MNTQLDDQNSYKTLDELVEFLRHVQTQIPPENIWIAPNYSMAALVLDLKRILHND